MLAGARWLISACCTPGLLAALQMHMQSAQSQCALQCQCSRKSLSTSATSPSWRGAIAIQVCDGLHDYCMGNIVATHTNVFPIFPRRHACSIPISC